MRDYLANEVRNIVLMGHSGAGKSSVVEAALYFTKATDRLGKTIDGTSVMDNDAGRSETRAVRLYLHRSGGMERM